MLLDAVGFVVALLAVALAWWPRRTVDAAPAEEAATANPTGPRIGSRYSWRGSDRNPWDGPLVYRVVDLRDDWVRLQYSPGLYRAVKVTDLDRNFTIIS